MARLATACRDGGASVLAWALLPNHLHVLLRSEHATLSRLMHRVLGGYAGTFNRRHHRHGHLFQNRFKSIVVEDEPYLLQLVRYIHLNPLRAGLVTDVATLDHDRWTGHSRLMGFIEDGWQDVDSVLGRFGTRVGEARHAYRRFVLEGVGDGRRPELRGGGLRRSRGACDVVATLARGRERWAFDERVLGSSDFVLHLQEEELARRQWGRRPRPRGDTLPRIVRAVAAHTGVSAAALCSGSKRRDVVQARALLSFLAVNEAAISAAAVAGAVNVTARAVVRVLALGARVADALPLHLRQID